MENPTCTSPLTDCSPWTRELLEGMGILEFPSFIIGRRTPSAHIWYRYCRMDLNQDKHQVLDEVEPISGIPPSFLDILSCVDLGATENDFWKWPGELGSFDQCHLWEAYRYAAILVLRRKQGITEDESIHSTKQGQTKKIVLLNRLLSHIDAIFKRKTLMSSVESMILNAVSFPLFIAGAEADLMCQNKEWRALIETWFLDQIRTEQYVQPQNALNLLREIWEQRALGLEVDADDLAMQKGLELGLL